MMLLGTAFILTSAVIFLLGIFIGQGIEARKMVRPEEPLVKIPVKPSAEGSAGTAGGSPKEELTFYETLTKLPQSQPALDGKVKEAKEAGKPLKREVKEIKPVPSTDAAPEPRKAVERKPETDTPPTVAAAAATGETAERKENGKIWTVQANAYPDERSAKLLVDRLKNKGYNAVITETHNKGKVWYRVRVGRYGSREEADKAVEDLKSNEKLEKAFATSRQQ
jgi:cell division septation protein DedD